MVNLMSLRTKVHEQCQDYVKTVNFCKERGPSICSVYITGKKEERDVGTVLILVSGIGLTD